MMTTAETGVAFLDLVTAHDLDGLCALGTDDWTMHGGPPGLPPGRAGVHQTWRCADDLGRLLQLGARIGAA